MESNKNRSGCRRKVPREIISQISGHSNLTTTNTYMNSFARSAIDKAVKVL